jgi:leucyl aminopeptidase
VQQRTDRPKKSDHVLEISAGGADAPAKALALAVRGPDSSGPGSSGSGNSGPGTGNGNGNGGPGGAGAADGADVAVELKETVPPALADEIAEYLGDLTGAGSAGTVNVLPRPGRDPSHVFLVGIGRGDENGWRAAGAGLVRSAGQRPAVTLRLPAGAVDTAARDLAEGAWLASYRYRLAAEPDDRAPKLRRLVLSTADPDDAAELITQARAVVDAVVLARDLTNAPSLQKSPKWFADRVANAAARRKGVSVTVHDERDLLAGGFGGILAVGAGSARPPRLVELSWRPRRPHRHVVLVGKGITFDSGGISIKPLDGMKLMRKDMGGAAAVCGAVLGAADLGLPVRVTALAPMAENLVSGAAMRPGDVVRHYGGLTTEVQNTDAEGRVVLGDALAYAVRRLKPDLIVDLATLTGASHVALGKRTAALFTHDDELARALATAGTEVGEPMWRLPLAEEYLPGITGGIADLNNNAPGPGALTAALYLREFTGALRDRWAHIDMSAPSWSDRSDGPLVKGATGWGVRMLLRWLATL